MEIRTREPVILALLLAVAGCADSSGPPAPDALIDLALENVATLDAATEGTYEAWTVGENGVIRSAGRFEPSQNGNVTVSAFEPRPEAIMITVEPPGDQDAEPSLQTVLGGSFVDGAATLGINHYVTAGFPLEPAPGTHVLATLSDDAVRGYPSYEDAGLWLYNPEGDTLDASYYATFTPLTHGWMYEGWVVRDYGTPQAVWLSYGKFIPNFRREQATRDRSGLGPFSLRLDYENALPDDVFFPGDDWLTNGHGLPVPGGLTLPLDLNGCLDGQAACAAAGQEYGPSRYTHVITIEPELEEEEDPWLAVPFPIQPYRNAIAEGAPDEPRTVLFYEDELPRGTARLRPAGGAL